MFATIASKWVKLIFYCNKNGSFRKSLKLEKFIISSDFVHFEMKLNKKQQILKILYLKGDKMKM